MKNKAASETSGKAVAIVVLAILAFTIVYVLLVSPEEREKLLTENGATEEGATSATDYEELLSAPVSYLAPKSDMLTAHTMPSINIFHKKEPKIVPLTNSLIINNGWFTESSPVLTFHLDNTADIDKLNLYFTTANQEGDLLISFNGNTVLDEKIEEGAKIVELPKVYLIENNKLKFKSSFPILFWDTNQYKLSDLGLKAEYELINAKEERTFIITEEEKPSIDDAHLEYYQVCNIPPKQDSKTPLKIYLNSQKLFEGKIDCIDRKQSIDVPTNYIVAGTNKILFVIEDGDFSFNDLAVATSLKPNIYPTYYFTLTKKQLDSTKDGDKVTKLDFIFEDNVLLKKAKLMINKDEFILNTREKNQTFEITSSMTQGTNFIKIIPTNSFNVVNMKVYLE